MWNKTVFISGANGMLPTYFVHLFMMMNLTRKSNIRVLALVRNRERALLVFSKYLKDPFFELLVQDVSTPIEIDQKVDLIIHAASQASPKFYGIDPVGTINANVLGTYNLLKLGYEKKVESFLLFSSGEVYGIPAKATNIKEDDYGYIDILNVRSCYAESKRLAETMCIAWFHQFGVPVKIARIFHSYGPGVQLDDGRVFADFIKNIVNSQNIVLNSSGSAERPFCYISDCIAALLFIMLKGEIGDAYNVANVTEYLSVKKLAELLVKLFPEKKLRVELNTPIDHASGYIRSKIEQACPNVDKIMELGWEPKISVSEGFRRTIEFIQTL